AGMMAAYELRSYGHGVDVFESAGSPGGFLRRVIPEFRLPSADVDRAVDMLSAMGVRFYTGKAVGRDVSFGSLEDDYDAVVVAVGACLGARPSIPGCGGPSVLQGIDLLSSVREGTAAPLEGLDVVVVGGGNTAVDCAMTCRMLGAGPVSIVCLENPVQTPAARSDLALAASAGVRIDYSWAVTDISGPCDGKVTLSLSRCLTALDEKGNFNPMIDEESPGRTLTADRVVMAVGQEVDSSSLRCGLGTGPGGRLSADPLTQGVPGKSGVFVAGDCLSGPGSVVEAFASGRGAALSVHRYLSGQDESYARDYYRINGMVRDYESLPDRARGGARGDLPVPPPEKWSLDCELEGPLSAEAARKEAERCLSCGRSFESNRTCWYCLPCEIDCPVQALEVRMPYQVR
ncbi:MAG: FAD-dependent oxidoreductase, partial [Desulfobulbaceae bacterium]